MHSITTNYPSKVYRLFSGSVLFWVSAFYQRENFAHWSVFVRISTGIVEYIDVLSRIYPLSLPKYMISFFFQNYNFSFSLSPSVWLFEYVTIYMNFVINFVSMWT